MHRLILWLSVPLLIACGGRQRVDQVPQSTAARPGESGAPEQDRAVTVVGSWALRALNRERVGRLLQLALDSASGQSFRTRVTLLMQGDVGIDPAGFTPTAGSITADGAIRIEIRNTRGAPPGFIVGRVAGDTIHLLEFSWGGEDQMVGGTRWALVREK